MSPKNTLTVIIQFFKFILGCLITNLARRYLVDKKIGELLPSKDDIARDVEIRSSGQKTPSLYGGTVCLVEAVRRGKRPFRTLS